jgi:hypothetical protein
MPRSQFRKAGLYALPNGDEFIVSAGENDSLNLRRPTGGSEDASIDYCLSRDGRIYHRGTRTNWGADDLVDTGRTIIAKKAGVQFEAEGLHN